MPKTAEIENMNNGGRSNTSANKVFWTAVAILVLLFIFSTVMLSIRLYDFAMAAERVLSIKSNTDSHFDIFSMQYENATGEVTVIGAEGEKVSAPGTDVEYTIRLRKNDKVALDYEVLPIAEFTSNHEIPIQVRVLGPQDYLAGDAKTWIPFEELNGSSDKATLKKGESVEYVFQWRWPFESGDDAHDTFLGDNVFAETIGVMVSFDVYATANTALSDNGGLLGRVYGDTSFYFIFSIILLIAIIILVVYKLAKKRNNRPDPDEEIGSLTEVES